MKLPARIDFEFGGSNTRKRSISRWKRVHKAANAEISLTNALDPQTLDVYVRVQKEITPELEARASNR